MMAGAKSYSKSGNMTHQMSSCQGGPGKGQKLRRDSLKQDDPNGGHLDGNMTRLSGPIR